MSLNLGNINNIESNYLCKYYFSLSINLKSFINFKSHNISNLKLSIEDSWPTLYLHILLNYIPKCNYLYLKIKSNLPCIFHKLSLNLGNINNIESNYLCKYYFSLSINLKSLFIKKKLKTFIWAFT